MSDPLLEVRNLSKTFPGLKALDDVSLSIHGGEIVALVGQNGSGKSTLVKILADVYDPDPGCDIVLGGGPGGGEDSSLHFIHQDLGLVGMLSTIENLSLHSETERHALLPNPVRSERALAEELIASFGGQFDVSVPVEQLSAAERTIVAIGRALHGWSHDRNVLVLDEPTASLHGDEVHKLFGAVRQVAERGAGVVFISHRLDEVIELADRVLVLRDGRLIANVARGEYDHDELVRLIAGAIAADDPDAIHRRAGDAVLRAREVEGPTIRSLDLELHAGEILGIGGVLGSGREEVASILFGAADGRVSRLEVGGRPLRGLDPSRAIAAGVAYVPGDRHRQGAVMKMTVRENMTLPRLRPLRRLFGHLDQGEEKREVKRWIETVDVRPADSERLLELFSGGNQQKVVIAKWLRNEPQVLLMDEPTQGVDVGAKAGIYNLITKAAAAGAGIMICSSEAKELVHLCDRVLIMGDGGVVAEMHRSELSEAALVAAGLSRGKSTTADRLPRATESEDFRNA